MKKIEYKTFTIELREEGRYPFNSKDNKTTYEKIYLNDEDDGKCILPSSNGVKVFKDGKEISKCLIAASGGGTGIHGNSSLIDGDKLLLYCANSVFCLSLPELSLLWKTKVDTISCTQIFKLEQTYIIHGEVNVTRVDKKGNIIWQFMGRDIFLTVNGTDIFEIHSDHILVSDFENTVYKLDLDGNCIEEFKL